MHGGPELPDPAPRQGGQAPLQGVSSRAPTGENIQGHLLLGLYRILILPDIRLNSKYRFFFQK